LYLHYHLAIHLTAECQGAMPDYGELELPTVHQEAGRVAREPDRLDTIGPRQLTLLED
jgi:hypothetical protein